MASSYSPHFKIPFLILLILFLVVTPPVSAENTAITFSELNVDWGTNQEILIYDGMGDYVRTINTTSSIVLDTDNISSYLFVFRPTQDVWFQNPTNVFELIKVNFGPLTSYALVIVVLFGLMAVIYGIFWGR